MADPTPQIDDLRRQFRAADQDHVFGFWDRLADDRRAELVTQATRIAPTLEEWRAGCQAAVDGLEVSDLGRIEPTGATALPEHGGDNSRLEAARERGKEILAAGRVGMFVVAGGQGTRLGFPRPKGAFPIGPVTDRSLFALQAQKIRGLARRIGHRVPWYVMTSPATDAETREVFEASDCFGIDPRDVMIFSQDVVPACDFEGRMILEAPHRIAESPNGHGGALLALADSGALDDMADRGIDRVFYYQVDNPLVRMGDPVYLGFHDLDGAEMSCKVIRKVDPMEKVGIVARIDGRPAMVEYTELADRERYQVDDQDRLIYWAGNIAIHLFDADFIRRVRSEAADRLPFHASAKKIPTVDAQGEPVAPDEPNGYKLERFVFDALPAARRVCVLEVRAEEEFSPVKNAEGKDSPESCRRDLIKQYQGWISKAGIDVPQDASAIEIDHAEIDSAEEASARGWDRLDQAGDVIRVATGMEP